MPLDASSRPDVLALLELSDDAALRGLDPFLERALILCAEWFHASGATLFLRDDEGENYTLAARAGIDATAPLGTQIRHGHGIAGTAIESGEPMLLADPNEHAQLAGKVKLRRTEIGSSLIIPLRTRHFGPLGVLCLSRRPAENAFSDKDLSVGRSVAGQVALAVANARLYAQAMDAVAEARALHLKLEAVVDCLGVGILVIDRQGWAGEVNQEAITLFTRRPRALESWTEYIRLAPSGLATELESLLDRALDGQRAEGRAQSNDGSRTWNMVASPMPEGGAALAIQDITLSERIQHELAEARRLAEIGQMTATIAHEIRNPLTGIRGAAQMVRELGGEAEEFGTMICEETDKLNRLCSEFLEFARPFDLHRRKARLGEIVSRVADLSRTEFESARVVLDFELPSDEPTILMDPIRIEQVVRNLVCNALHASAPGNRVSIRVGEGWFEVEDNGGGISEVQQQNLFVPFFTTKPQGTGLGLSVVKKIIDAHGGAIHFESKPGHGTRFRVQLGTGTE
ncbi:MAG TPA: ATP-binding protein [Fimbriimonadaceae bacterium]|nr:ATP-binding protein [Fimbriimonadaceae bacterium]